MLEGAALRGDALLGCSAGFVSQRWKARRATRAQSGPERRRVTRQPDSISESERSPWGKLRNLGIS